MEPTEQGSPMGHECLGGVEEVGSEVRMVKADGFWARNGIGGAQADAIRSRKPMARW